MSIVFNVQLLRNMIPSTPIKEQNTHKTTINIKI